MMRCKSFDSERESYRRPRHAAHGGHKGLKFWVISIPKCLVLLLVVGSIAGSGAWSDAPAGASLPPTTPHSHLPKVVPPRSASGLVADNTAASAGVGSNQTHQLSAAESSFSLALFRQLNALAPPGSNVAASPYSLAVALAMLELGALGSTASQIATALDTPTLTSSSQSALWRALSAHEGQAASRAGIDFDAANGLWLQRGFPLNGDFDSALNEQFGASLGRVDFSNDSVGAAKTINDWGRTHTHGKITQLLSPQKVKAAELVLANAEYFKGDWEYPFDPEVTAKANFHPAVGAPERVPFMTSDLLFVPATSGKAYDAVELPYQGGRFTALVIMPTTESLPTFVSGLTPAALDQLVTSLSAPNGVYLSMPKFGLTDNTNLSDTLEAMGIRDAFDDNADLSGMSSRALQVSRVQQQVYLKVNEKGTTAAAATEGVVGPATAAAPNPQTISMTIDHPFLFLIRDSRTGSIICGAEVEKP